MNPKQLELPCRLLRIDQITFLIIGIKTYEEEVIKQIKLLDNPLKIIAISKTLQALQEVKVIIEDMQKALNKRGLTYIELPS